MRVSFGTVFAVILAAGALATGTVRAAPTDAATHWFVRGEHFTYSRTLVRTSNTWTTDLTFRGGVVRERRRIDTTHLDHGRGTPGLDNRTVRTTRLVSYTTS